MSCRGIMMELPQVPVGSIRGSLGRAGNVESPPRALASARHRTISRLTRASLFAVVAAFLAACIDVPGGAQAHASTGDDDEMLVPVVPAAPPVVSWYPETPVQGAALTLVVNAGDSLASSAIAGVDGIIGGQRLAFERGADGGWIAVGGISIDARDSITVPLLVHFANTQSESLHVTMPVVAGEYRMERLSVAPRFGQEPDSALARRMADESARARAVSRGSLETPRLWSPPFHRPRPGRITSGFGHGRTFNGQVQSRHMGTDFAGAVGTPVTAANCGIVRLVGDFYLAGNAIYVDHGAGLVTGYFHLSESLVAEGDTVRRGQLIGRTGATGRVTGPHLHWIARFGTTTVNPMSLFALDSISGVALPEPAVACADEGSD